MPRPSDKINQFDFDSGSITNILRWNKSLCWISDIIAHGCVNDKIFVGLCEWSKDIHYNYKTKALVHYEWSAMTIMMTNKQWVSRLVTADAVVVVVRDVMLVNSALVC